MGFNLVHQPSRRLCSRFMCRFLSQSTTTTTTTGVKPLKVEQLTQRDLVLVKGHEASNFLQGLITNDMNHLSRGNLSIYGLFLNKGGRVLYDSVIYTVPKQEEEAFYVECDSRISDSLIKHLKIFRVRKKIDIAKMTDRKVWVAFASTDTTSIVLPKRSADDDIICTDPRLKHLGTRLLLGSGKDANYLSDLFGSNSLTIANDDEYREHRYRLGVGEGIDDLPSTKCFPLEANGDFLLGVSFHKGCYVGQELTARTHHTGVVRKRLMPLKFAEPLPTLTDLHSVDVFNETGQSVGKMRGYCNGVGLGLLRIEPALAATKLTVNGINCDTQKPLWWPFDRDFKHLR